MVPANLYLEVGGSGRHSDDAGFSSPSPYALQKAAYLELGREDQWHGVVQRVEAFSEAYRRAVRIIEETGHEPWLRELRPAGP
jgi:hypothetical protein